jgi:TatD DNase family protein
MMLVDSHSHLQDPAIVNDFAAIVGRARDAGVAAIVLCGYDTESNRAAIEMAAQSDIVQATVGWHPHDARQVAQADLDALAILARREDVVGVGEIGLDFYRDLSPRPQQREVLDAQLAIALEAGKPVSVHSRGAEAEIFEHLAPFARRWPGDRPPGVMHCFGGNVEQAQRYGSLGFLVSLSCAVTYPRNEEARAIARELPLGSLCVETDSPYLPPQGRRGERNEPSFIGAAIRAIAAARDEPVAAVAAATSENAARVFGLRIPAGVR